MMSDRNIARLVKFGLPILFSFALVMLYYGTHHGLAR